MKPPQEAQNHHHCRRDDRLPTHDHAHWPVSYPRHIFDVYQKLPGVMPSLLKILSWKIRLLTIRTEPLFGVLVFGHARLVKVGGGSYFETRGF
jgi:hypothetical protein